MEKNIIKLEKRPYYNYKDYFCLEKSGFFWTAVRVELANCDR